MCDRAVPPLREVAPGQFAACFLYPEVRSNRRRFRMVDAAPLLSVRALKKYFPIERGLLRRTVGYVKAVDDVSFDIARGEVLALVGESGLRQDDARQLHHPRHEPTAGEAILEGRDGAASTSRVPTRRRCAPCAPT